jgi:hypothetical protein
MSASSLGINQGHLIRRTVVLPRCNMRCQRKKAHPEENFAAAGVSSAVAKPGSFRPIG